MPNLCKYPLRTCSIEADRFGAQGPGDATAEIRTARGEDGIFFHGLSLHGCCEGHQFLRHTRVPDLYQIEGPAPRTFSGANDGRWQPYAAVGGYSAGRLPMIRYLQRHHDTVKFAFVLDPSWDDKKDYGATIIKPWITGGDDRRLLVIYGNASAGVIIDHWIAALRGLKEDIRKRRIVVWRTGEGHYDMKKYIRAMEEPSYRPPSGAWDRDFAESFS